MSGLTFRVDHTLCFISVSPALEERLGMPDQPWLGRPYYYWCPAIREDSEDALQKAIGLGRPLRLVGHRFFSLGGAWTADVVIEPLELEDGSLGAEVRIGTIRPCPQSDTGVLRQRCNDMARVAAKLSHGVRNPLNAIKGAVTYLQGRYSEEPDLQEFSAIIVEEITCLEQFISGFLSTSGQGKEPELIDVNPLLNKVASYVSLQARAAGVAVVVECSDVQPVRMDCFQLEQAILNLVNNALAALCAGGRVALISRSENRNGFSYVVVEVADNGSGMEAGRIASLHDPASEPEMGRERGFGLFITREVMTSYGGDFEIVSKEGLGTRVRLLLPVEQPVAYGRIDL